MLFYIGEVCVFHVKNKYNMEGGKNTFHTRLHFVKTLMKTNVWIRFCPTHSKTSKYPNMY